MTLSELARSVGIWVEDVELLLERELLPPSPQRRFTEWHASVLRLVMRMRGNHRLSLDTIRAVLVREYRYDVERAERALLAFVEPDPSRSGPGPLTAEALSSHSGLAQDLLDALVERGLIPSNGPYAGHHLWLCEAVAGLAGDEVARADILALIDVCGDLGSVEARLPRFREEGGRVAAMAQARVYRRLVGDLVGRARFVGRRRRLGWLALAAGCAGTLGSVRFYRPSPLFCMRHGVEALSFDNASDADVFRTGRLALGLGRLGDAARLLETALRRDQTHGGLGAATLAVVRALDGDVLGARNAVVTALSVGATHSVVTAYSALALAISAPSTTSSLQSAAWIELALELLERSRAGHTVDEGERLEAALARGRVGLVVPRELGCGSSAREDLEAVLSGTMTTAAAAGGQLERQLLRINALYFLGMDLDDRGQFTEAKPLLAEDAWIDPTSEFARESWLRLQKPRF